jgi:hypothetical protein
MWRTPTIALALLSSVACGSAQQQVPGVPGPRLTQLAQKAKAEGRRSATTSFIIERDSQSTLSDVFERSSIVVVIPTGEPRVRVHGDGIMTAQDFRIERWLRRVPPDASVCYQPWPGVAEDESLVTTRLAKGTAVVDGVRITETTHSGIAFSEGQPYLLLVHDCPGRRIEFAFWVNSIFNVSNDGQIVVPDLNAPQVPFVRQIADLKTIAALEKMLKSASASSHQN